MKVQQTVPLLRIFDVEQARAFYIGFLGFRVDWEHRFGATFPLADFHREITAKDYPYNFNEDVAA